MPRKNIRKILVVGDHGDFTRAIWRGALRFIQTRPEWQLHTAGALMGSPHRTNLADFQGDGVLYIGSDLKGNTIDIAAQKEIPTVFLNSSKQKVYRPAVMTDETAIGNIAARFFLDRGFTNLAFYSTFSNHRYSQLRRDAFCRTGETGGANVAILDRKFSESHQAVKNVLKWLHGLEKPCGLLGVQDGSAMQIIMLCHEEGIRVPEELAILGIGNTEFMCESMRPTLSSIDMGSDRTGYEACTLLEKRMQGRGSKKTEILIPPRCIIERESTLTNALTDPVVSRAVSLIREHLHTGPTVDSLVSMLDISRRNLEQRFARSLQRTPGQTIREAQMQRTEELLRDTDLSIAEVAEAGGFNNQSVFAAAFRRERDMTPMQYRRKFRNGN